MARLARMQEKGQVTVPVEIRRRLGLESGDLVAFVDTDAGVVITRQEVVAADALKRIRDALKEKGITLDELVASGRQIRAELVEELYGGADKGE